MISIWKKKDTPEDICTILIRHLIKRDAVIIDKSEGRITINYLLPLQRLEEGDRAGLCIDTYDSVIADTLDANPAVLFADLISAY